MLSIINYHAIIDD